MIIIKIRPAHANKIFTLHAFQVLFGTPSNWRHSPVTRKYKLYANAIQGARMVVIVQRNTKVLTPSSVDLEYLTRVTGRVDTRIPGTHEQGVKYNSQFCW